MLKFLFIIIHQLIKKSKGLLLFDKNPEFESFKYGIWTYYDEDGTIKEKRMLKP